MTVIFNGNLKIKQLNYTCCTWNYKKIKRIKILTVTKENTNI